VYSVKNSQVGVLSLNRCLACFHHDTIFHNFTPFSVLIAQVAITESEIKILLEFMVCFKICPNTEQFVRAAIETECCMYADDGTIVFRIFNIRVSEKLAPMRSIVFAEDALIVSLSISVVLFRATWVYQTPAPEHRNGRFSPN